MKTNKALIIVDMQNDFMPSGTLPVPESDTIIPTINKLIHKSKFTIALKDWHPEDNTYPWPKHCIQNTKGAEHPSNLVTDKFNHTILRGTDPNIHPYGGFYADNDFGILLPTHMLLSDNGIDELDITGVALEYCVVATVLQARYLCYKVNLILDACAGIYVVDESEALMKMVKAGVNIIHSNRYL